MGEPGSFGLKVETSQHKLKVEMSWPKLKVETIGLSSRSSQVGPSGRLRWDIPSQRLRQVTKIKGQDKSIWANYWGLSLVEGCDKLLGPEGRAGQRKPKVELVSSSQMLSWSTQAKG